jgi:hypothetical protein
VKHDYAVVWLVDGRGQIGTPARARRSPTGQTVTLASTGRHRAPGLPQESLGIAGHWCGAAPSNDLARPGDVASRPERFGGAPTCASSQSCN